MNKFETIIASVLEDRIKDIEDVVNIQCQDGNWNYDPYMHGMANGLLVAENILKNEDKPFLDAPKKYLCDKISNQILNTSILTVAQLLRLKPIIEKKALNLLDLMSETSKKSIKYEPGCIAELSRATPKIGRWIFNVKCSEHWSQGPYDVRFRVLKATTKDPMTRDVEVSCDCNAWRFNGADFNALRHDYSERQYSDGSAPSERDPKRKYLICKHVAACIPIFSGYIIPKGV